jgi:hypothetical protein
MLSNSEEARLSFLERRMEQLSDRLAEALIELTTHLKICGERGKDAELRAKRIEKWVISIFMIVGGLVGTLLAEWIRGKFFI